jgi:hypothetical protein
MIITENDDELKKNHHQKINGVKLSTKQIKPRD